MRDLVMEVVSTGEEGNVSSLTDQEGDMEEMIPILSTEEG